MSELTITHAFVRTLTKSIRDAYGKEPKHTEVMDLVASSLGWSTDALMHKLKNDPVAATVAPGFEAPPEVSENTLLDWLMRRRWRTAAEQGKSMIDERGRGIPEPILEKVNWAALRALTALSFLAIGEDRLADETLDGFDSDDLMFSFTKGLVGYSVLGDSPAVRKLIVDSVRHDPQLLQALTPPRGVDIRDFVGHGMVSFVGDSSNKTFLYFLRHFPSWAVSIYVEQVAVEAGLAEPRKPAVPIEQSVTDEGVICLFDGEKRILLQRHVRSKFNMSADDYRKYWGLPANYPMSSPGYAREKRAVAEAHFDKDKPEAD